MEILKEFLTGFSEERYIVESMLNFWIIVGKAIDKINREVIGDRRKVY